MLYKIPVSYISIILTEIFIAAWGAAFAFGYHDMKPPLQILIIAATATLLYLAAGFGYKLVTFHEDKVIFKRPLLGLSIEIGYDKIKSIKIKHVYRAGAQMFIIYENAEGKLSRIQFDYRRKKDLPLLEILAKKEMKISKNS